MIQGTQNGLNSVSSIEGVASVQPVPLAMLVDFTVMDSLITHLLESNHGVQIRYCQELIFPITGG